MIRTSSILRLSLIALSLATFADTLDAQGRTRTGGRTQRATPQRSAPRAAHRAAPRAAPRARASRSTVRAQRSSPSRARSTPQRRSSPSITRRSTPSQRSSSPRRSNTGRSTVRSSTRSRSTPSRSTPSHRSRSRAINVPSRGSVSGAKSNRSSTRSSTRYSGSRTSSRRPSSTGRDSRSTSRRLGTARSDRSAPRAVGRSVPSSSTSRNRNSIRRGLSRPTNSSSYRDRLRTLYNRRPSKNSSTRGTAQRRRSQIVNRDINDRFETRLKTSLRKSNPGTSTGLRRLGGDRARYKLPGSRNLRSTSSSTLGVRNRSSTRAALGTDSLRNLRSTRAPSSIRHIPRSRTGGYSGYGDHGGYHSSGHISSITFGFGYGYGSHYGTWGLYAYPYHYSHYLPYSYYIGSASLALYWNSSYPYYCSPWWWPRYSYAPGRWSGYYGGYYDAPTYYYPNYSSTVVYGVEPDSSTVATEADAGSEADRLARLAQQHLDLGDFYFKQGRFKEAAESYMRALAYAPNDGAIHFVVADALFAQGDYHYAAFMISKGLELDPDLAFAEADKRSSYENPEIFDRQMETLRGYLSEKPFDAAVHMVMGYNLRFSSDSLAAKPALERALEIDSGNRAAKALLEALDSKPAKKDR